VIARRMMPFGKIIGAVKITTCELHGPSKAGHRFGAPDSQSTGCLVYKAGSFTHPFPGSVFEMLGYVFRRATSLRRFICAPSIEIMY
jgi:hypothetical protein